MSRALAAADAAWEKRGWKRIKIVRKERTPLDLSDDDAAPVTR